MDFINSVILIYFLGFIIAVLLWKYLRRAGNTLIEEVQDNLAPVINPQYICLIVGIISWIFVFTMIKYLIGQKIIDFKIARIRKRVSRIQNKVKMYENEGSNTEGGITPGTPAD